MAAAASLSRELKRTSPNRRHGNLFTSRRYRDSYAQTRLASILPSLLPSPPRSVNFIFGIVSS